ncbi:hypothetical protein CHLNCDRAFT_57682 [Chlorella variabilis]|uniref:3-dehydrosphinganine reductase n=1 Tax=Chlorella variabilis TaxID=554065 RepID=E1ZCN2_CHLVA|nr:hypothetical protein CHLNCDRAFT_57682 [Chlorella variabilis]EFN56464.1 hypothetical protein CHLNCDRAFT_57682 [Chlorella variabilis]|eukprot:XP_005848566.1 hypothetical protein CHLNCDRAFT_57682 [Chlorella variabilis]
MLHAVVAEWWFTAALSLLAVALPAALMWARRGSRLRPGTHVLVTGGSKGLGLALALQCAERGCSVTIVARNKADLATALQQLQETAVAAATTLRAAGGAAAPAAKLQALSADTTDMTKVTKAFEEAERNAGPIDVLICNAGLSLPGLFVEQDVSAFELQMRVNYLGNVHSVKAALPGMLQRRAGRVVLVTSSLAILGFAGYSSYAASKWALRGLADCLRNELQGTGVEVSVAYPPDTDTPGYAQENASKPELCLAVNSALGSDLFTPDKVARLLLRGIERGQYHLPSADLGQNLLVSGMTSLSPKRFPLLVQVLLGPILPLATSVFGWIADRAATKHNTAHGMPPRR